MNPFTFGPFVFNPGSTLRVAGNLAQRWTMQLGSNDIAERVVPADASRSDVIEVFGEDRGIFVRSLARTSASTREPTGAYVVDLVRSTEITGCAGETLASFDAHASIDGMSSGLIDDRFETWAVSTYGVVPMTRTEFDRIAVANAAAAEAVAQAAALQARIDASLPLGWIADTLPDDVLTSDIETWRAPTSLEIRHVVGEGSFTGISGAKAAKLVGVTPQNFRKYTARDDARTRQKISYAMWHLLLHKLGVQRA